jgi:hypothetical protein
MHAAAGSELHFRLLFACKNNSSKLRRGSFFRPDKINFLFAGISGVHLFSEKFMVVRQDNFTSLYQNMKNLKKALRLSGFILLMVLASLGLGIGAGIPVPPLARKEDRVEVKVELKEAGKEEDTDVAQSEQKH